MPKTKLTAQAVKGLPPAPPEKGRVDYQDTVLPGLVLRVSSSGTKSYSVSWWQDGARPRVTLGVDESSPKKGPAAKVERLTLTKARAKAKEVLQAARIGADPAAERRERRQAPTFAELAREYVERWAKPRKEPKGAREDENRVERVLIPRWGRLKAQDVRKRDVVELLDEYVDEGKVAAANRVQALVSKIYNFGIERDAVAVNPAQGIRRQKEQPRVRVLDDAELKVLLPLFRDEGLAGLGFELLLLTGQRPKEVFGMRWSEVDGETWDLPAERSKNGRPNSVPLSRQARAVLGRSREYDPGSGWVFPSIRDAKPFTNYGKHARRLKAKAKLAEPWNVYDLKSTCLTGLERLGFPGQVIAAVANHAPATVTARHYALYDYSREKAEALQAWGDHIEKLDPATKGKVVRMRRRA